MLPAKSLLPFLALAALCACGKNNLPGSTTENAASDTVQILTGKDNTLRIVVENGHFRDLGQNDDTLPENVSPEEMVLFKRDDASGITIYADDLGPARSDAQTYFANLKNELAAAGLQDAQTGIATANRMNYRFSQTTPDGGILNENCIAIHDTRLYNVCANSSTATQKSLASVLKDVSLIKPAD